MPKRLGRTSRAPGRRPPTASRGPIWFWLSPFSSLIQTSIQAASLPGCQGERCPRAQSSRGGGGRQGSWHGRGRAGEGWGSGSQKECRPAAFGLNVCDKTFQESKLSKGTGRFWQNSAREPVGLASVLYCLPAWQAACVPVVNVSDGSLVQLCKS